MECMKIGLVRHFKVKKEFPKKFLLTQQELSQWIQEYDVADIEEGEVDLGNIAWKRCFTSDLPRAEKTARKIYQGPITVTKALREIPICPLFRNQEVKLPLWAWGLIMRGAWLCNHRSQIKAKQDVQRRLTDVIDEIMSRNGEDTLIVSHGILMVSMRQELLKRGFKGPRLGTPANGRLYVFEK
jgi:broad specificity phosphatase PhoE